MQNRMEGHRVEGPSNRDLEQKLTYQQLLNLNHDLSKENMQLKNIGNTPTTQATVLDRNSAISTASSTSSRETKTQSSTTQLEATPCCTSTSSPSSPCSTPTKPKSKSSRTGSKPSTRSSSTWRRSTRKSPTRTNASAPNSPTALRNSSKSTGRAVPTNWGLISHS